MTSKPHIRYFALPYQPPGWCPVHGWHASNVVCAQCKGKSGA